LLQSHGPTDRCTGLIGPALQIMRNTLAPFSRATRSSSVTCQREITFPSGVRTEARAM
jgi:hypothetical protein